MAETQEIGCTCRCRIGLEVVQPESIGLQLEQFHIGFADVPTLVISGGGTTAIEQFYLMPTACELQVIEHDDIIAMVDELWQDPTTTDHAAETIKVIINENGEVKLQWKTVPLWQARFEVTSSYKGANSVQFDANGGQIETNQVEHAHGTPVGELPMPQRPGYRFQGWSTDKEGLNMVSASHVIEQNTVLYAQWTVDKNTQGWFPVDGTWYYLSGGQAHEGFFQDSGLVYYAEKGTPITGWKTVDGKHYYFGRNGVMQTGLLEVDGIRYLLGEDGAAMTGWAEVDGYTCYLNPNGSFCSGWQSIDGQLHYFDATSGKLVLTQNQSGSPFDFVVHDKNLASSLLDPILGLLSPVPGN